MQDFLGFRLEEGFLDWRAAGWGRRSDDYIGMPRIYTDLPPPPLWTLGRQQGWGSSGFQVHTPSFLLATRESGRKVVEKTSSPERPRWPIFKVACMNQDPKTNHRDNASGATCRKRWVHGEDRLPISRHLSASKASRTWPCTAGKWWHFPWT